MRKDAFGLLWEDHKRPHVERTRERPPIPLHNWRPPTHFPSLAAAKVISFDVETYDPELADFKDDFGDKISGKGPGWGRGKGHIVGVSVGTDDGWRAYFPMRHTVQPEYNIEPQAVLSWLRVELGRSWQPKVGANLMYDLGWLAQEGVAVVGELVDVQFAEALLSEDGLTNLEHLGKKYLKEGKESPVLYEWSAKAYGGNPTHHQRKNIWRAPPSLVGPYAESDADLPLRVIREQYKELLAQGLVELFQTECALLPLLLEMRLAGVSVDVPGTEKLRETLLSRESVIQGEIDHIAGYQVNVNAAASIAPAFDSLGISYPLTEKTGQASITKGYLDGLKGIPIADKIKELRAASKLRGTFVESYILNSHIDGKIYCQFHPLRADSGGTRSGRFSSSTPNLQNIPSRDPVLAPLMRGLFIPDVGHKQWRKFDYSQIEYRMLAHFAVGQAGQDLRAQYNLDPSTCYHKATQAMVQKVLGREIERKPIKNINFGLIFGMGFDALMELLHLSKEETKSFIDAYHSAAPYAKATMEHCSEQAEQDGYISTILGRRSRFDLFEPSKFSREFTPGLPYSEAWEAYGPNLRRSGLHKALNRLLQGSAADMLKVAMLKAHRDGVFGATGVPRLTVHDELDFSDPGTRESDEGFKELKHIMETALKLNIPVIADEERGPDWGHVEEV